ncbi:hypothetical protein [Methylocystis sp.]|uniref:hypothetical protein n=1 Tax=Methylocystis sp. TaxID=1911079 RepID=UPI003DA303E7
MLKDGVICIQTEKIWLLPGIAAMWAFSPSLSWSESFSHVWPHYGRYAGFKYMARGRQYMFRSTRLRMSG